MKLLKVRLLEVVGVFPFFSFFPALLVSPDYASVVININMYEKLMYF